MNNNQFIFLIRGRVGCGKTSLLNKISQDLKFEKIIIDEIKKETKNFFDKAGIKANELLKQGHNIVVEEAFLVKKTYK